MLEDDLSLTAEDICEVKYKLKN